MGHSTAHSPNSGEAEVYLIIQVLDFKQSNQNYNFILDYFLYPRSSYYRSSKINFCLSLQNDMGLKAHDCAKLMGQKECAEFLILYETSLEMASELSEVQNKREALVAEHNELRTYFKYV